MILTLSANTGCNLKCPYCIQSNNIQKKYISEKKVLSQLEFLKNNIFSKIKINPEKIVLVGGEPGLWSKNFFYKTIDFINTFWKNKPITIDTNGLFFKTFPEIYDVNYPFKLRYNFYYHIADPESHDIENDIYSKDPRTETIIVITNKIQNNKKLFIKYEKNCNRLIYTSCKRTKENNEYEFNWDKENCFIKSNDADSVKSYSCMNKCIDFCEDKIILYSCCASNKFIEINEKSNIQDISNFINNFIETEDCEKCFSNQMSLNLNI